MSGPLIDYDAFLCHDKADKELVKEIAHWLEDAARLRVWLDEWNLVPGDPWMDEVEKALEKSRSCLVFLGLHGIGPWQHEQMQVALQKQVSEGTIRVVPALLPGTDRPAMESRLPKFLRRLTWVEFHDGWEDEEALHRLKCGILGIPPGPYPVFAVEPVEPVEPAKVCPYRGLEVFREQDQQFFFGREAVVERLFDHLKRYGFLAVLGPSGSGKSSVVQAGLVPELRRAETLITIFTPREHPGEELAFALRDLYPEAAKPPADQLIERLKTDPERKLYMLARELMQDTGKKQLYLVVDQFEELFTQTRDDDERRRFLANLLGAVEAPSSPASVILTMRSDFLGRCAFHSDLNTFIKDHLEHLEPLRGEEMRQAIVRPARLAGLEFEKGLVDRILSDVRDAPGELPLVEHALLELFERRDAQRLTLRAYQEIGAIEGALAQRAEQEFERLSPVKQETLRRMFVLRLIQPGEGTEDTRRRVPKEEILAIGVEPRATEELLARWTRARLLTTQRDEARGEDLVDVAHEALIRKWDTIRVWMAEDREDARLMDALSRAAKDWQQAGRLPEFLFQGVRLVQMEELREKCAEDLTEHENAFVEAGVEQRERQTQEEQKRVWDLHRLLVRYLWRTSKSLRDEGHLLRSLHFAVEAAEAAPSDALAESVALDVEGFQPWFALLAILEQEGGAQGAAVDASGIRVLTWSRSRVARLWDARTGQPLGQPLRKIDGGAFDRSGARVLTWGRDGTVCLWDAETGRLLGPIMRHRDRVNGAAFDDAETRILAWSSDGVAQLWDAGTGEPCGPSLEHGVEVSGAALNAPETRILTWSAGTSKVARLWDAGSGRPVGTLRHDDWIDGLTYDRTGSRVLTWGDDRTARQWDAETGRPIGTPLKHEEIVDGAVFDGRGDRILTWSDNNAARLWDAATCRPHDHVLQHDDVVRGAAFNTAGTRVLTWSQDGSARLWHPQSGRAAGPWWRHQGKVNGAAFYAAETGVLTWSVDGTVRLWDARTGEDAGAALLHRGAVHGAFFSAGQDRLLTWTRGGPARTWKAASREPAGPALEHGRAVYGALFSKRATRVLTWSQDGTACLWNTRDGAPAGPPLRHEKGITGARFNASETRVLTWSDDNTARLWEAETGELVGKPFAHGDWVNGAAFDAVEARILTWSGDGTACLWEAETGRPAGVPMEHEQAVNTAVFNGAQQRVLTAGKDGTAHLWDARTGQAVGEPMKHRKAVNGALFDGVDKRVLTWSQDGSAGLWDARDGRPTGQPLKHQAEVRGATFDSAAARVLSWSHDGTARLWDAETGDPIGKPLEHDDWLYGAAFDSSEKRVLTWSKDRTARLWDAETGDPISPVLRHAQRVQGAAFAPAESRVLTWTAGAVQLWDVDIGEPIGRPLEQGERDSIHGAVFDVARRRVLTWSRGRTARLWELGTDLDFPRDALKKQVQALTGTEFIALTQEVRTIEPQRWRRLREDWERLAREHFAACENPRYNLWRRFHPEEAKQYGPSRVSR